MKSPVAIIAVMLLLSVNVFAQDNSLLLAMNQEEITIEYNSLNKWDYFVYPVPAEDELNVKITKGNVNINKVVVTNEIGDEILYLVHTVSDKIKLDVSNFEPGTYFIRIVAEDYASPKMKRFYIAN